MAEYRGVSSKAVGLWRSLLFVPVTVERFLAGAARRGADAIILDLEDSVPAAEKTRARALIAEAVPRAAAGGADIILRVNRPWRQLLPDLEAAIRPDVAALLLPKIESADHLRMIAETVEEIEIERGLLPGHIRLIAMLETPGAIFRAETIATAHPRVIGLTVGSEDLALATGMQPDPETLLYPMQQAIFAAAAAGIQPLGFLGSIAEYGDPERFRATIRRSRRLGFTGALVVHPKQVPILNEEFTPGPQELDEALRVVTAYREAQRQGRGAIALDGRMIDAPVLRRAEMLLARAAALTARHSR